MIFGIGFGLENTTSGGDYDNGPSGMPVIIAGGVLMACGALAGIPASAVKLRQANREIDRRKREPSPTTLHIGPTGLALRHRF